MLSLFSIQMISWTFVWTTIKLLTGIILLVSRNPTDFRLVFKVSNNTHMDRATLFGIFRKFYMDNGPDNWKTIEYVYQYEQVYIRYDPVSHRG
jgi:hypothetical protein